MYPGEVYAALYTTTWIDIKASFARVRCRVITTNIFLLYSLFSAPSDITVVTKRQAPYSVHAHQPCSNDTNSLKTEGLELPYKSGTGVAL